MLNSRDSAYYEETKAQAMKALKAYPKGLQIGGGINADNAAEFVGHFVVGLVNFAAGFVKILNHIFQEIVVRFYILIFQCIEQFGNHRFQFGLHFAGKKKFPKGIKTFALRT